VFGAGVSLGMFAGILIGSLVTWWLGEWALGLLHRLAQRMFGRRDRALLELLLQ
jgi:membrane protein YqaA with SNARE-associated domain